jgi:hypothetical protein
VIGVQHVVSLLVERATVARMGWYPNIAW